MITAEPTTKTITIALIGNPNTGKTSLFNSLTGMRQRVGNYPGITVETKSGIVRLDVGQAQIVDLPGTYSLAAISPDERIVVDALAGHVPGLNKPDVVLCVVDASNLRRNLFLASQVADLGIPMVIALNLWDAARKEGIEIDTEALSARLGVPVIPTVATRDQGRSELVHALSRAIEHQHCMLRVRWPESMEAATGELDDFVRNHSGQQLTAPELRRLLFDVDSAIRQRIHADPATIGAAIESARKRLLAAGFNPLAMEALLQYEHLGRLLDDVIQNHRHAGVRATESIDQLMIHRAWGLIIFMTMMYVVFQSVYAWAGPLMDGIDALKGWTQGYAAQWLAATPMLESLVTDGIIEGVGAFLVFLPQIIILFFFISLLEDTGYMSRAAFLMDKLFHWCGLNGKSFVPMLSSYACAVPGIMATRTIEDPKARLTTILVAPLMSCSARLPVYVLLIGAFVEPRFGPWWAGFTLFVMHFVGLAVAIPVAWLFTRFVVRARPHPFLLEMPPYRIPRMRNVLWRMWLSGREFVVRAGTVIFSITVVVWALLYFPRPADLPARMHETFAARQAADLGLSPAEIESRLNDPNDVLSEQLDRRIAAAYLDQSLMGRMGQFIQPAFAAAGFDWRITVGVLASFPAREVIISTLGVIYSLGGDVDEESRDLRDALRSSKWTSGPRAGEPIFTLPVVLAIMVFFALCSQCASTLAVIARETNWKWSVFSFVYMTVIAWLGAVIVYQIGYRFFYA